MPSKHNTDCARRKSTTPYLCTCGMTDEQVADAARSLPDHSNVALVQADEVIVRQAWVEGLEARVARIEGAERYLRDALKMLDAGSLISGRAYVVSALADLAAPDEERADG